MATTSSEPSVMQSTTTSTTFSPSTASSSTQSNTASPTFSPSTASSSTQSNTVSPTFSPSTASSSMQSMSTSGTVSAPSSTSTSSVKHQGVATGTVVGIGIGTAVAGALLALLAIWILCIRPRQSKRAVRTSRVADEYSVGSSGKQKTSSIIKGPSPSVMAMNGVPLEAADDSQIRKSMESLHELIYQHVENHYSTGSNQGRREDLNRELAKSGWNDRTDPTTQAVTTLLINPATRRATIRHIISRNLIQHIDLKSSPELSLLPAQIVASAQTMLKVERTSAEQEAFSNSFTKWRQLTASLVSPPSSHPDNSEYDSSLHSAVERNVKLLNEILRPFIRSGKESQLAQSDNLESIILECARFGLMIFSQPAVWVFGWRETNLSAGRKTGTGNASVNQTLVVFPSIGRVVRRKGGDDLKVVVDAVTERI